MSPQALLLALALALALGFGAGWSWRGAKADTAAAQAKTEALLTRNRALQQQREATNATLKAYAEARDAEHLKRQENEAAGRRAESAHRSLLDELAATRTALAQRDPTSAAGCQAASQTAAMCTELLGVCSERRTELARFADRLATAGEYCVGAYQALTPTPTHPHQEPPP